MFKKKTGGVKKMATKTINNNNQPKTKMCVARNFFSFNLRQNKLTA